jgi:hypothetical protein
MHYVVKQFMHKSQWFPKMLNVEVGIFMAELKFTNSAIFVPNLGEKKHFFINDAITQVLIILYALSF